MHHGTCVTHVPWCMSESLIRGGGEKVPGIPGACASAISRIWQEAHGIMFGFNELTHWGWDEIAAILQTTFSNAFSWMKICGFHLWSHWSLFLKFELTIFQHWSRQWLRTDQVTSHCLNQFWWLVYWHIYVSLSLNELTSHYGISHMLVFWNTIINS